MKAYKCHKIVMAGKIEAIYRAGDQLPDGVSRVTGGGSLLRLEGGEYVSLEERHHPEIGGYLVRYADGYLSYSPAKAFEEGYALLAQVGSEAHRRRVERLARTCHEANRAYSLVIGDDPATIYPRWAEAPQMIRESARIGVRAALEGMTPEELHQSWCATKVADGWVYGAEKNLEKKEHPCLRPYAELPPAQQAKDALFHAIVSAG